MFKKPPYNSGFAIYLYLKAIDPMLGPTYFQQADKLLKDFK